MKVKYVKNEFGIITKIDNNQTKIPHKNTKEQYLTLKSEQKENLFEVKEKMNKHLSSIQTRLLNINLQNISKAIDYYFDGNVSRINAYQDNLFNQSFKYISGILRNTTNLTTETIKNKNITEILDLIKESIMEQRKYILEIQETSYDLKRKNQKYSSDF